MSAVFPFIGRTKEIARLRQLHAQRRHVLVVGPAGIGKTALIHHLKTFLDLLVSSESNGFKAIARSLEDQSGAGLPGRNILPRKSELLALLAKANQTIVFDSLGWTNLKLTSFLECVSERGPVWLCCRSTELWDIGLFQPFLWKFVRLELHPFSLAEARVMVQAAAAGKFPSRPWTRSSVCIT
jgi:hypothetical protein